MFTEDDLLPISALQHLVFCERQWALIHLEHVWTENRLTVEGKQLHERADLAETESRGNTRIARGLQLQSLVHGLSGRADVVEFQRLSDIETEFASSSPHNREAVQLPNVAGSWKPLPVEYKRGKPKFNRCDEIQLCAQALCLEEMLGVSIPAGSLFYGQPRRRFIVHFDNELRQLTERTAARLHQLHEKGETPTARYSKKCQNCSLMQTCLPKTTGSQRSVSSYLSKAIADSINHERPGRE